MIHALLKGKVATGEDAVTSAVFGALRYMPHEIGLAPWLSHARRLDETRLAESGPWRADFWPSLQYDDDTVELFSEVERIYIETAKLLREADGLLDHAGFDRPDGENAIERQVSASPSNPSWWFP